MIRVSELLKKYWKYKKIYQGQFMVIDLLRLGSHSLNSSIKSNELIYF
jgi:hypothetical protein